MPYAMPARRILGAVFLTIGCALLAQQVQAQTTPACTAADLRGMQRHWLFGKALLHKSI